MEMLCGNSIELMSLSPVEMFSQWSAYQLENPIFELLVHWKKELLIVYLHEILCNYFMRMGNLMAKSIKLCIGFWEGRMSGFRLFGMLWFLD